MCAGGAVIDGGRSDRGCYDGGVSIYMAVKSEMHLCSGIADGLWKADEIYTRTYEGDYGAGGVRQVPCSAR